MQQQMTSDSAAGCERDVVYLRPEVKLELLAFRWYAWPHLVAPLTHAMNLSHRHVSILRSFLANPAVHERAASNPELLGGPFIALPAAETPTVRSVLERIQQDGAHLLALSKEFKDFDRLVQESGKGFSLDEFYEGLPESLQGCVELSYDPNNHPRVRILEDLLYAQNLNDPAGREIGLSLISDRDRKFFLTNPRTEPGTLFIPMGFADRRIDLLARLRIEPMACEQVARELSLSPPQVDQLNQFLTPIAPIRRSTQFTGEGVRLRYFGHACVLLETADVTVLLDPLFAWERDEELATLTFHDLPDHIDFVVFSHAHMDHFCPEVIVQLRERVGCFIVPQNNQGEVCDPSMRLMLKALGCRSVRVLEPFESVTAGSDGEILSLPFPGEHCGLSICSKHSVLVNLLGRRFLFLVDSDAVDPRLYQRLRTHVGRVDAAFVGMECKGAPLTWFYGPLLTRNPSKRDDDSRRGNASNGQRAWEAISRLDCGRVFVYAMGNEPWNRHLLGLEYAADSVQITESNQFVERCRAEGIPAERLHGCAVMNY